MITVANLEDGQIKAKLVIPEVDAEKIRSEEYKKIKKNVVVKGFRKGKVPVKMAENYVGLKAIYDRRLSNIMMEHLLEKELMPYQYTQFEINKDLSVEAQFYPVQMVKFKTDLNTLKVKEEPPEIPKVTDEELKMAKDVLIQKNSVGSVHEKDYKAKIGDNVIANFKINVDDKEEKVSNHKVTLGFGVMDRRIEESLVGISPGETRNIELKIKDSVYKYEINCSKIVEVDVIDMEELLDIMGFETESELDENLKKQLGKEKMARLQPHINTKESALKKVIDNLRENSDYKLPEKLLDDITGKMKSDIERSLVRNFHAREYERKSLLISAFNEFDMNIEEEEMETELQKLRRSRSSAKKLPKNVEIDTLDKILTWSNLAVKKATESLIIKLGKEEINNEESIASNTDSRGENEK